MADALDSLYLRAPQPKQGCYALAKSSRGTALSFRSPGSRPGWFDSSVTHQVCGIGRYGYALGLSSKGFAFTRYALAVRSRATALTAGSPGDSNQSFAGLADMEYALAF